jgi:hypothetical protein
MNRFGKLALACVVAALAVPGAASAKVFHFSGKATGKAPSPHLTLTFDVTGSKGRATKLTNVWVKHAEYGCHFGGGRIERDFRIFDAIPVKKNGTFNYRVTKLPPDYDTWFMGKVAYPKTNKKTGKRTPLTVTGFLSSEFGYGVKRDEYNCIAADDFTATAK